MQFIVVDNVALLRLALGLRVNDQRASATEQCARAIE